MSWNCVSDVPFELKMLWASVLRRAVFDYVLYKGVRVRALEWKKAAQYVFSPCMRYENGLSFVEVCSLFSWDPEYLRLLTTRLTRADIKKMESSQFRGDFTFDVVSAVVERTKRWKSSGFAVPFCLSYHYGAEYFEEASMKVVRRESLLGHNIPLVRWQTVAA